MERLVLKVGFLVTSSVLVFIAPLGAGETATVDNMRPTVNYAFPCRDSQIYQDIFCQTDNAGVTIYRESTITAAGSATLSRNFSGNYNPTDLQFVNQSPPVYTGGAETDIIYQAGPLRSPYNGYTWCDSATDQIRCDQHYVRFDDGDPSIELACHETGHAVGLTHPTNANPRSSNDDPKFYCMTTPVGDYRLGGAGTLNFDNINETY